MFTRVFADSCRFIFTFSDNCSAFYSNGTASDSGMIDLARLISFCTQCSRRASIPLNARDREIRIVRHIHTVRYFGTHGVFPIQDQRHLCFILDPERIVSIHFYAMERNYRCSTLNHDLISSRLNALFQGDLVFSAARYGQCSVLIFIICSQSSAAHEEITGESFPLILGCDHSIF